MATKATISTARYQMVSTSLGHVFIERTIGISILEAFDRGAAVLRATGLDSVSVYRDIRGQVAVQFSAPVIAA